MTVLNEHKTLIETAVSEVLKESVVDIAPLIGGISGSALYEVRLPQRSIVARICDPNNPYTDLAKEYHNMTLAADNAIAPKVYYTNPDTGLALMDHIKTQSLTDVFDDNNNIEALAKLMHKLHAGPKFEARDPAVDLPWKIQSILPAELAQHPLVINAINVLKQLAPDLKDPGDVKPCHCDVNKNNLLFNGTQFYWVDWTTSSMDSFYFDLAMIVNLFFYDSEQKAKHFLETYFSNTLSDEQQQKMNNMRQVVCIYLGVLMLFGSNMQKIAVLDQDGIDALPDYVEALRQVDNGQLDLTQGASQQKIGWAFLKSL